MTIITAPEQVVILDNISWETFERLLAEKGDVGSPRFAYDRGRLEIMAPLIDHEIPNRTLNFFVELVAIELDLNIVALGSTTFTRPDLYKGFEPDSCFYIQNAPLIEGKRSIDLLVDPPPDLVVEIDITSFSLDRFPIFSAVGVPEVWRYDGKRIMIYTLQGNVYQEVEHSLAFHILTRTMLHRFLEEGMRLGRVEWAKRVRAWVHAQLSGE